MCSIMLTANGLQQLPNLLLKDKLPVIKHPANQNGLIYTAGWVCRAQEKEVIYLHLILAIFSFLALNLAS